MLGKGQVLYGLRNLATGDEEETRISDCLEDTVEDSRVAELEEAGNYIEAYRLAIRDALTGIWREDPEDETPIVPPVEIDPLDVLCWALGFESCADWDGMEAGTMQQVLKFLAQPDEEYAAYDGTDNQYGKECAINLAFEMWDVLVHISEE